MYCGIAAEGNYTDSTLFVDVVGSLAGVTNSTNLTSSSTASSITTQAAAVSETVKAGYMVRASADWNVSLPSLWSSSTAYCPVLLVSSIFHMSLIMR